MIFVDNNILVHAAYPPEQKHAVTKNALTTLSEHRETLCIARRTCWSTGAWPLDLRRLFTLLPYTSQVLETWQRIVIAQGILGKQVHDAHLVGIMQVHSVMSILTFNVGDFERFPEITVLSPTQV